MAEKSEYEQGIAAGIKSERGRIAIWVESLAAKYFIENKDDLANRYRELSFWIRKQEK